jgi:hypothetical protein
VPHREVAKQQRCDPLDPPELDQPLGHENGNRTHDKRPAKTIEKRLAPEVFGQRPGQNGQNYRVVAGKDRLQKNQRPDGQ